MSKQQIKIPCNGYQIAADLYLNSKSNQILLAFVGLQATKERNADFMQAIAKGSNMSVLVIDFSGHGESPFDFANTRPAQHLMEAVFAFEWLAEQHPTKQISVMGTSYGGYIAAYLSRFKNFKSLVLRTPAIYEPVDFYSRHADIDTVATATVYRKNKLAINAHPLFLQPPKFTGQTLLVVHGKDEWIPTETTDVYIAHFSASLFEAKELRHGLRDPANPQDSIGQYIEKISSWLKANKE